MWYSLLLLGYKPVQRVTVLNTVGNCNTVVLYFFFLLVLQPNVRYGLLINEVFFLITHNRHNTVARTPPDAWSVHHRDLYWTTHNTHNRQTSMPPVGFKPMISAGERLQTYALECTATDQQVLHYNIILWDHNHIRSPTLTETSLRSAWLYTGLTLGVGVGTWTMGLQFHTYTQYGSTLKAKLTH